MNIQIRPEAKALIEKEHHHWITLHADRECVGANCSESYVYPLLGSISLQKAKQIELMCSRFQVSRFSSNVN